MNGWEKFRKEIINVVQEDLVEDLEESKGEFSEATFNHLFDTDGPTTIDRDISEKEQYFRNIFNGYIEIDDSLETLKDIPVYIRSFPFKGTRITKPRYLRYHIENYSNEVYILKERLVSFLNIIEKAFKSDKYYRKVRKVVKPMYNIVTDPLEGIINTRGAHVHESRFRNKDLSRLETMDLFVSSGEDELSSSLEGYYQLNYRQIRKKWKKQFKNNNDQIVELLSIYGNNLLKILFDQENEELIYPKDLAG